jgi:hypothetical protein
MAGIWVWYRCNWSNPEYPDLGAAVWAGTECLYLEMWDRTIAFDGGGRPASITAVLVFIMDENGRINMCWRNPYTRC